MIALNKSESVAICEIECQFRPAELKDLKRICSIIRQAQEKRKGEGSDQWQDGYPSEDTIRRDIANGYGHVLFAKEQLVGYVALIFDGEPAYATIEGKWLTEASDSFAVIHRLAVAQDTVYRGVGTAIMLLIEPLVIKQGATSIKVDTNYDNTAMLHVFKKLGYQYCGEVMLRQDACRKAFEKVLVPKEGEGSI